MTESPLDIRRIGIIGFGEAGTILGQDVAAMGRYEVATYDILFHDPIKRDPMLERASRAKVKASSSLEACLQGADLAISAVTATSSLEVARQAAQTLRRGQIFLDINSVAPDTKRASRDAVESAGADYVEAAVMAPVPPSRLKVAMLLGGRRASALAAYLSSIGMNTRAVSEEIGTASAIKMCRSIMIKGLEALTVECLFAARQYGAENAVLESLHRSFPSMGWNKELPDYLVSRVAEHGRRRAAEMREVAAMLSESSLEPHMAAAAANRQDWLVDAMEACELRYDSKSEFVWQQLVDAINGWLDQAKSEESAASRERKVVRAKAK